MSFSNEDGGASRRIREWAKRLLQLDRRNNLLYFKRGRSAVGITGVRPDELEERLGLSGSRGLEFPYAPPSQGRGGGFAVQAEENQARRQFASPHGLITDCELPDLQRRLRNLQRRDREWDEEQGLNVLYLAIGFLNWIDADNEEARSPLLLIPCDLERDSPRDPFRLVRTDDEISVNHTLLHQLKEWSIDLPQYGAEGIEDESIEGYIAKVSAFVANRSGWSVDSDIFLGIFAYSKLAMYEDLVRMCEQGVRSDLTLQLAGSEARRRANHSEESARPRDSDLAGGRLDDLLDLHDQFTVVPADFSQLRAIEDARRGRNLVIHGPPGTGKSQTIANLIATFLADGKRVLFVSEKTAALDVVKRRLEECKLGMFCLDLHSERGSKSAVYQQLNDALNGDRIQRSTNASIDELVGQRDLLNGVVRSLHERREPLGQSVYEVQGLFAQLRHLPMFEDFDPPPVAELTGDWIRGAKTTAERIARRPEEFRCHDSSRWIPLRATQSSLQLADLIRGDMAAAQAAIRRLRDDAYQISQWLGVPSIQSSDDAQTLVRTLQLLQEAPTIPRTWLDYEAVAKLRQLAGRQAAQQRGRRLLEQTLADWVGVSAPPIDYRAVGHAVALSPGEREAMNESTGASWRTGLGRDPNGLLERVTELVAALNLLKANAEAVHAALGISRIGTLGQLEEACALAASIRDLEPVPEGWLAVATVEELERESRGAQAILEQLFHDEDRLDEDVSDGIVDEVDHEMLIRYRTDHQSFLRHFRGTYRRDQRTVRGHLKTPRKLSVKESLAIVELALGIRQRRERWRELEPRLAELLETRFQGRETNWERLIADCTLLKSILSKWPGDPAVLHELLARESGAARRFTLESTSRPAEEALARYRRAAAIGHDALMASNLDIASTGDAARRAIGPIRRIRDVTAEVYPFLVEPLADFDALTQFAKDGVQFMRVVEEDEDLAPALAEDFGHFFKYEETEWDSIATALDWTARFLDTANGRASDVFANHATSPRASEDYAERAEFLREAIASFSQTVGVLNERFDIAVTRWAAWHAPTFSELQAWSEDLSGNAGDALGWVEYRDAVRELDEQLGPGTARGLRALTDRAQDVPGIVCRRIYTAWLEEAYQAMPELRSFSRVDHEGVRSRFRKLDQEFPAAARQRVRERIFSKYPDEHVTPLQGGQLAILHGELSKRRRQMSVRRLIERIPNLLQTLKPCFLLSPLAVSQYLPAGPLASDHLEFDVVIFDEASQVLPEDALPAIDRARQAIVVGDRRQLPPTTFFRASLDDDEDIDEDGDADSFEGRESILDVMVGQVGSMVADRYLSVHYRSRCESLIRFSNHAFYEDRLLTFPSPNPTDACVRAVYLQHAIYDAGASRTNRDEAERVADIVFELMSTQPSGESLGVVALSRPQADLIENLIEERLLLHRHLDHRFSEELAERFFVKNLENVQGDERDHIILSIGYGRTASGSIPNRFGPLNREGGERRLNVAVTRARKSMTVVHSLRAGDITSNAPGAQQLRRYIEYVHNPENSFEAEISRLGEPESPFEESVLAALRARGHLVDAQVGVSGYRIDLAIKSQDEDRYDLGIECDGAAYHSSPTARDRDWLRQQVLEGLGWRIHRVWSTAWVRDPDSEIAAIERALERSRVYPKEPTSPPNGGPPDDFPRHEFTPTKPVGAASASANALLFDEYRRFEGRTRGGDPLSVSLRDLSTLVRDIVSIEHPVHVDTVVDRVRSAYGIARSSGRIRERVEQAIELLLGHPRDGTRSFLVSARDDRLPPRREPGRPVSRVAPSELDEGLLLVTRASFGMEEADLIRETARQFGWRRTGQEIDRQLRERIERLLESGWLSVRGLMLVPGDAS